MKTEEQAIGNISGLRAAIEASAFDAVVIASPENVRYVADVPITTQASIRDRLALIIWAKGREPIFVLCQVEEGFVRQESWIQDIRTFKEFVVKPIDLTADVLTEIGLAEGRIGLETAYLPAVYADALRDRLPKLDIAPAEPLLAGVRAIKTRREIEILRGAYRGTEKALLAVFSTVREGEDEKSMANRLADAIMHSGADMVAFNHINAGPNTGFPHMPASDYKVRQGDFVKADAGGFYKEYWSNVGRTAKLGAPTAEEQDTWKRLREIHHTIIDMLRPGNTGRQLFEEATRLHDKHGIPFPYAHNGHGVGLNLHEHPIVGPYEDMEYRPGMVSTVETRVRWVGVKGLHMEDLVEITDGAPIVHSDFFDNEEILVI